jgi:predicted PurR-regulated permease PerM
MVRFDIPGYSEDFRRFGFELSRIWNAFLRGQFIIFFLTGVTYIIILSALGVRYALQCAAGWGVPESFAPLHKPGATDPDGTHE